MPRREELQDELCEIADPRLQTRDVRLVVSKRRSTTIWNRQSVLSNLSAHYEPDSSRHKCEWPSYLSNTGNAAIDEL